MSRSLVHPFQQILEAVEPALPETGHLARPVDQRRERAGIGAVMRLAALVAASHQPGLLQHSEMFRNDRLRDAGTRRQRPDRLLSLAAEALEERPPGGIGKRPEQNVLDFRHSRSIPHWLWINV